MDNLIDLLVAIDKALRSADVEATFVGGAITPLLLDAIGAAAARSTRDVDCIVETATHAEQADLEARLEQHGFAHCLDEDAPICRWTLEVNGRSVLVDVMPANPTPYGFSNPFFPGAVTTAETLPGTTVRLVRPAYALATKIAAWQSRGGRDLYRSADFEDIIALFDGCPRLEDDMSILTSAARALIATEIAGWFRMQGWDDVVASSLPQPASRDRLDRCIGGLKAVAAWIA